MSRAFVSEKIVRVDSKSNSSTSMLKSDGSEGSEYSREASRGLILE